MKKILVVYGTRPEAVKLAPVIKALKANGSFEVRTVLTGQHRELVATINDYFGIVADYDLDIMRENQDLFDVTIRVLDQIREVYAREKPDAVIVQGDTSSAFASAQAAFYLKIPVYHVEAGLRTADIYNPFPEEMNRRMISGLATLHFAPSSFGKENLLRENIPAENIYLTGNTVIDSLYQILEADATSNQTEAPAQTDSGRRMILLTTHRRESDGLPRQHIFEAVRELADTFSDIEIVFPAHPNPQVTLSIKNHLKPHPRIKVIPPVDYFGFLKLMNSAYLILTDSGGVQEEAPALGKPVIVLRDTTERPEVIAAGNGILAGTSKEVIIREVSNLLSNESAYKKMSSINNLYGEGNAADKITAAILDRLT